MSIEKSLNKFDDYYHHLLLGIASVLLITPISSLAKPISSPATPETVPSKTAMVRMANLSLAGVRRVRMANIPRRL